MQNVTYYTFFFKEVKTQWHLTVLTVSDRGSNDVQIEKPLEANLWVGLHKWNWPKAQTSQISAAHREDACQTRWLVDLIRVRSWDELNIKDDTNVSTRSTFQPLRSTDVCIMCSCVWRRHGWCVLHFWSGPLVNLSEPSVSTLFLVILVNHQVKAKCLE